MKCLFTPRRVQGPLALITPLQDHLRHFFDKQRHPIGSGHNLLPHGRWQLVGARHQAAYPDRPSLTRARARRWPPGSSPRCRFAMGADLQETAGR
jgi:hypothetical protein